MNKLEVIEEVYNHLSEEIVVANIGVISKLAYKAKDRFENFYMTGSMGLATSIALGLAIGQKRKVICFEGDGSLLMNLGSLCTIGSINPKNLMIFVLDDRKYESTGKQRTLIENKIELNRISLACGIKTSLCESIYDLEAIIKDHDKSENSSLIQVIIDENIDSDKILMTPIDIKERFMKAISNA